MAALTLVLGGVRSGKSRWAERLAAAHPLVTYLATAQAGDAEMVRRIAEHRRRRPAHWQTVEEPWDVAGAIASAPTSCCLLVEDLGLWLTNLLVGVPGHEPHSDEAVRLEVDRLLAAAAAFPGRLIVVSQEVGLGIVPVNALARRFGDLLGNANQRVAEVAEEVYWCVAGIPVPIKRDVGTQQRKDAETRTGTREEG